MKEIKFNEKYIGYFLRVTCSFRIQNNFLKPGMNGLFLMSVILNKVIMIRKRSYHGTIFKLSR